ncbi:MAG: toxin [Gammaproteobacteria bacterium]|nr:toxin [Gammaproteobacteria bacterium]
MNVKQYDFSAEKNHWLKENRGVSFEEIITAMKNDGLLSAISHPNQLKYPNQQMYLVDINDYVYVVPFVKQDRNTVFLKTIFKSRKLTKNYLVNKRGE